jgi:type IV pilus assembly protein PilC
MALFTSQSATKHTSAAAHPGRQPQRQGINIRFDFGPSKKDILNFTNQLAVMVRAGISLQDALESIGAQIPKVRFRAVVLDLKSQIEGGECFSRALARYPDIFGNLYVNMIAAAEISGSMSAMLQQLVAYLDQESETRSQIIGAMVYPTIIATMAVTCVTFLLMFVLPRFLLVFAGKEHLLPAPTKLIMALSGGLRHYWFIIFPAIAAVILGFWYLTNRTAAGKFWWDKTKLHIPLLGTLCRNLYITRSMHTMGVLTNAGVPILDTISITALISGNILYERMWRGVYEAVRQGKKIAASLAEYSLMPSNVVQMIQAGEESGSLGEVLKDISEFYARQLRTIIKTVTSMIEPLMIVVMGVLVGFIAMSIILPIFKMSSVVTSG